MLFHYFFHLILIFSLHCQLFLRISGITKICNIKITSQCKILIVPEEGWFGQPKYSTHIKTFLRCASFCLYFLHNGKPASRFSVAPQMRQRPQQRLQIPQGGGPQISLHIRQTRRPQTRCISAVTYAAVATTAHLVAGLA